MKPICFASVALIVLFSGAADAEPPSIKIAIGMVSNAPLPVAV